MRVISGSARGKKLCSVEGWDVRPTLDRVKESVFNMIAFDLHEASVLDLFCGSGALGIEALSRGAKTAVFVDVRQESIGVCQKNLNMTHLENRGRLVMSDSIQFLNSTNRKFDIIFIDPPYESDLYGKAVSAISAGEILKPEGKIIIECDIKSTPPFDFCGFHVIREKKYGRVKILIMKE